MRITFRSLCVGIAALCGLSLTAPASAAALWLDSDHSSFSGLANIGVTRVFSNGDVSVRASAWSVSSSGVVNAARLGVWAEGLGVVSSNDNTHTIDNVGSFDFVVLQFSKVVRLGDAQFRTGWDNLNDTDATIGYITTSLSASSAPTANWLKNAGFTLYSSDTGTNNRNVNPEGFVGNMWLIGASMQNPDGSRKLDGFKLEQLEYGQVVTTGVPEPSVWVMLILGFAAIGGAMRRQNGKKRAAQPLSVDAQAALA